MCGGMIDYYTLVSRLYYDADTGCMFWLSSGLPAGAVMGDGYIVVKINQKKYPLHRLAWFYMTCTWPDAELDHINHNRLDNRFSNLRQVTCRQNSMNRSKPVNNKSGVLGVIWDGSRNKWKAYITINGKHKTLGRFSDKNKAISERKRAEVIYGFHPNHGK